MRSLIPTLALALTTAILPASALGEPPPVKEAWDRTKPKAEGAWIRLNPVPGRASAGYLTITGGGQPDRLTSVTAPGAKIEMHSMTMAGAMMTMGTLNGVAVPAGGRSTFAPGGNHLMIYGLNPKAKTLALTLKFASGASVTTIAAVRAVGADPMSRMDMAHH